MVDASESLTKGLTRAERERLSSSLKAEEFPSGADLCVEGALPRGLIFVRNGRVSITKRSSGGIAQAVANLEAPTVVGELELVSNGPCKATVTADGTVTADVLSPDDFDRLVVEGDSAVAKLLRNIARIMVRRLDKANARIADMMAWELE